MLSSIFSSETFETPNTTVFAVLLVVFEPGNFLLDATVLNLALRLRFCRCSYFDTLIQIVNFIDYFIMWINSDLSSAETTGHPYRTQTNI